VCEHFGDTFYCAPSVTGAPSLIFPVRECFVVVLWSAHQVKLVRPPFSSSRYRSIDIRAVSMGKLLHTVRRRRRRSHSLASDKRIR
jgi:hypothetical protein